MLRSRLYRNIDCRKGESTPCDVHVRRKYFTTPSSQKTSLPQLFHHERKRAPHAVIGGGMTPRTAIQLNVMHAMIVVFFCIYHTPYFE